MPPGIDLEQRNWRNGNYDVGMIMTWPVDLANSTCASGSSDLCVHQQEDGLCTRNPEVAGSMHTVKLEGALVHCLLVFLPMKRVVVWLSLTDPMDEAGE